MALPIPDLDTMEAAEVAADDKIIIDDTSADETKTIEVGKLLGLPTVGWTSAGETWSYSSWSSTTRIGVIVVPSDATTKYTPGMRIQITQSTGGTKYGIIHAVGSTSLSVFFPIGTTLNNETISTPYYSVHKVPYGFNADPSKWQLTFTDATDAVFTASPNGSSWYNKSDHILVVGVGAWELRLSGSSRFGRSAGGTGASLLETLSSSTSSESDPELTGGGQFTVTFSSGGTGTYTPAAMVYTKKYVLLATQTTYNVLLKALQGGTTLQTQGASLMQTTIKATSAYL